MKRIIDIHSVDELPIVTNPTDFLVLTRSLIWCIAEFFPATKRWVSVNRDAWGNKPPVPVAYWVALPILPSIKEVQNVSQTTKI